MKKNHGAYVRDDKALAKSDCGKKVKGRKPAAATRREAEAEKGPCQGPPPWAGKDKVSMTPRRRPGPAD